MLLEFSDASVKHAPQHEEAYWVSAFDDRFGDYLIVATFPYDNTHEEGFYKKRAEDMAKELAKWINEKAALLDAQWKPRKVVRRPHGN